MASGRYRSPDSRARSIRSPLLTFLLTLGLSLSGAWDLSWSQVQGRSDQDIAAEIDTLDARLATLRKKYTDAHPDVIELKRNRDALVRLLGEPPPRPAFPDAKAGSFDQIEFNRPDHREAAATDTRLLSRRHAEAAVDRL